MLKPYLRLSLMLALCAMTVQAQLPSTESLRGRIEQIARNARGRVGVAIALLETGESLSLEGGERFPMQSVYKLPIGMAGADQGGPGTLQPEQKDPRRT